MMGKKAIFAILVCLTMTMMPFATMADEGEKTGEEEGQKVPGWDIWWPESGHFNYSDGKVQGNYVSFNINESSGQVSDYTVMVSIFPEFYPMVIYEEKCYVEEDGEFVVEGYYPGYNITYENLTVFESIEIEGFIPVGHPGVFSDLFVFQGEDALMMFYDRDWNHGFYTSGDVNNTIIFTVADGFEISMFPDDWEYKWRYEEEWEEEREEDPEGDWEDPDDYEEPYYWEQLWTEIWIEYNNTVTNIIIDNGNATIDNNTISVQLNENGHLDISTWTEMPYFPIIDELWYDAEYEEEMMLIEEAREDGLIAGEGWYFEGDRKQGYYEEDLDNSDFAFYEDPTFNMEFIDMGDDIVDVVVDSGIPDGRIVMINLNDEAIEANSVDDLSVKLDGKKIEHTKTLDKLMDQVDGDEAKFYALFGDEGITVFVYVPHFSTHTITIESILSSTSNILVPTVLALVLVAVAVLAILLRGKKAKEEY